MDRERDREKRREEEGEDEKKKGKEGRKRGDRVSGWARKKEGKREEKSATRREADGCGCDPDAAMRCNAESSRGAEQRRASAPYWPPWSP